MCGSEDAITTEQHPAATVLPVGLQGYHEGELLAASKLAMVDSAVEARLSCGEADSGSEENKLGKHIYSCVSFSMFQEVEDA